MQAGGPWCRDLTIFCGRLKVVRSGEHTNKRKAIKETTTQSRDPKAPTLDQNVLLKHMEMTRPIIYINGWPGAGKETISMALVTLLGGDDEARLVRRLFLPSVKDCVNLTYLVDRQPQAY
jgi:hypothetical protein